MTHDQLIEKMFSEPMYLKNSFEEAVIRTIPENGSIVAYVKFKGEAEFKAQKGSSVVADATIEMNIITKKEYDEF